MRSWLIRNWFTLLLVSGLLLAVWFPMELRPIAQLLPLRWAVGLSLFLTAWTLPSNKLLLAMRRPVPILWGLLISYALLPLLALGCARFLPTTDLQLGLFVIVCVPCTLSAAVIWTRQAGGEDAIALLLTILTTSTAWLVTPSWLTNFGPVPVSLDALKMMRTLALVLAVPVALGQLLRLVPGGAETTIRYRILINVVARLLIAVVLLAAVVDALAQVDHLSVTHCLVTFLWCSVLHLLGFALGMCGGKLFGLSREDRIAVAFAGSQKTLPVALLLFEEYYHLDYPLASLPLLIYHGGQLLLGTVIAEHLAVKGNGK